MKRARQLAAAKRARPSTGTSAINSSSSSHTQHITIDTFFSARASPVRTDADAHADRLPTRSTHATTTTASIRVSELFPAMSRPGSSLFSSNTKLNPFAIRQQETPHTTQPSRYTHNSQGDADSTEKTHPSKKRKVLSQDSYAISYIHKGKENMPPLHPQQRQQQALLRPESTPPPSPPLTIEQVDRPLPVPFICSPPDHCGAREFNVATRLRFSQTESQETQPVEAETESNTITLSTDRTHTAPPAGTPPASPLLQALSASLSTSFTHMFSVPKLQPSNSLLSAHPIKIIARASSSSLTAPRRTCSLQRTISFSVVASQQSAGSQWDDYCTPADQPIAERTDAQRVQDIVNARLIQQSRSKDSHEHYPTAARGINPQQALTCSHNVFLPASLQAKNKGKSSRHSPPLISVSSSRLLADYEVMATVGEGNFGCVMKCRHRLDGAIYAIKKIHKVITGDIHSHSLLREVFALAAVATAVSAPPSIVRYHLSWVEDHELYIVTEWCGGGSLADVFKHTNSTTTTVLPIWNEASIQDLLRQMCTALQFIHTHGFAHLDIKPANIFIRHADATTAPNATVQQQSVCAETTASTPAATPAVYYKLGDFGLCTLLSAEPQQLPALGDKDYLPLSAIEDEDHCTQIDKIDVFMLAMTVLEIIQGKRLTEQQRERIRGGDNTVVLEENSSACVHLSPFMIQLVGDMLHVDPELRISSATVLQRITEHTSHPLILLQKEAGEWKDRWQKAEQEKELYREKVAHLERYTSLMREQMATLQM